MSKLDGLKAFDRVLDKLVQEGHLRVVAVERQVGSAESDAVFLDLYAAVESAAQLLDQAGLPTRARELVAKLTAAKKFVEPIPF